MATKRQKDGAVAADESGTVKYVTSTDKTAMFDMQVKGEVISGQWDSERKRIHFVVPAELAEAFEQHWHVQVGNIVKVK